MAKPAPPKIIFPVKDYPIKVVCRAEGDYKDYVMQTMIRHAFGFNEKRIKFTDSKNGKFCSITFYVLATSEQQLSQLNTDLRKDDRVMMVI
jgi:putative lipoic acid-binding regulatory protein